MRRAAPSCQRCFLVPRHVKGLASLLPLVLSCACSVYSSDLLQGATAGLGAGGSDAVSGGRAGGGAGKTGAVAGETSGPDMMGAAGDGDVMSSGGTGGTAVPGAGSAGVTNTGGVGGGPSGGSANVGGSSAAGSSGAAGGGGIGPGDLIDGFEDEDLTLEQTDGRGGVWYLFDDLTVGKAGPSPLVCSPLTGAPAALGGYAMHITATGFTGWGSGLGVDFRAGKKVYDASKYTGIRFWARVGEGKNTHHRVQIADATTDKAGGKCDATATAVDGEKCDDHFGANLTFTSAWAQYVMRFDALQQIGWGNSAPTLDKAHVYGLQVTAKAKLDVDLWLDQIEFF